MIRFNHFQAAMMALLPLIATVTYQSINYVNLAGHTPLCWSFVEILMFLKLIFFEIMIMFLKKSFLNHNKYGCPLCHSDTLILTEVS